MKIKNWALNENCKTAKLKTALSLAGLGAMLAFAIPYTLNPAPLAATAGINKQINFQGKVTNADGTNVANGSYTFRFRIYTAATGDTGSPCLSTCIWEESKSLGITDGVFQTNLGDVTSLPGSIDFNTDNIYLGIKFNGDAAGEMSPRVQFTASPYAFNSDKLQGISASGFVQLAPSGVQVDSSTNASIFINKTGASGNIFELQKAGVDQVLVDNTGNLKAITGLVVGSGATSGKFQVGTGATISAVLNQTSTFDILQLQNSGSAVVTVSSGGNVGLGVTPGASNILDIATGNTKIVNITSDLSGGARSTYPLKISQADNSSNNNTAGLLTVSNSDAGSTVAILNVDQVNNGNGISITGITSGDAISAGSIGSGNVINAYSITSGVGLSVVSTALTSGIGLLYQPSTGLTSGSAVTVAGSATGSLSGYTGAFLKVTPTRTNTATSGTVTDSGNFLNLTRSNTQNGAGGTYAITGALANLQSNCTQTAGTCTDSANILSLNQQYANASGTVLNISNSGTGAGITLNQTTGTGIQLSTTSGVGIGLNTVNSGTGITLGGLTSGKGVDFGNNTTSGTQIFGGGSSITTGTGLLFNTTSTAMSSGNAVNVTGSASGALAAYTGSLINVTPTRTLTSGSINDSGNFLNLTRANTVNNAGSTFTVSGALANLQSNCTQTAGTCTDSANILNLNQQYASASGAVLRVQSSGTGNLLQVTDNTATAKDVFVIADGGAATFKTQTDAAASFQIQNTAGNNVLSVDTSGTAANNFVTLGKASTLDGKLVFKSSGGSNTVTLQAPSTNPSSSYALQLPTSAPALNQCLANDGTTLGQLIFTTCGGTGNLTGSSVRKAADETVNNSSALQNDDDFTLAVGTNETWLVSYDVSANSGVTPGIKFAVTAPAGSTCRVTVVAEDNTASADSSSSCGTALANLPGYSADKPYRVTASVATSTTPGNVVLQWAQGTANASNTIVRAGSTMQAFKMGSTTNNPAAFIQGGSTFGQTGILGTADNFALNVVTAGTTKLTLSTGGDLTFAQGANRTLSVAQASSGAGNNFSVIAGQGASGQLGGNLILQAGANGTGSGTPGSVIVKANGGDSTTAFQIQQSGGTEVLTADTTNSQVIVRGINSIASIGGELLTGNCSGTNWSGTGAGPYTHSAGSATDLTCTISGGVTNGATYQITYDTTTGGATTTITPNIGGATGKGIAGAVSAKIQVLTTTATGNPTFTIDQSGFTGTITNISYKLVTTSNTVLSVQNSNASGALEIRSGGAGLSNTFIGLQSGKSNTTGGDNTAVGASALQSNVTGNNNSAFGWAALKFNSTGASNAAFGVSALTANISGGANTAIGGGALLVSTTGNNNTAVGFSALLANTTGSANSALGNAADVGSGNLTNATAVGANALVGCSNCLVLGSVNGVNGAGSNINVGIGTTGPDSTLHVVGGACFEISDTGCTAGLGQLVVNSTGANGLLRITDTTATARDVLTVADGGATTLRNQTDSTAAFQVQSAASGTDVLTVDTTNSKLTVRGINSDATIGGTELLTGNCTGSGWSGTGSGPYTHSSGFAPSLVCTITGGVTAGATYQVTFDSAPSISTDTTSYNIGNTSGASVPGTVTSYVSILKTQNTNNPTFFFNNTNDTGSITNISFKLVTISNSVLVVQNSSGSSGTNSLELRTSTASNSFVGQSAGESNTSTGADNTAFGTQALQSNTVGLKNTAVGSAALQRNSTGIINTGIGWQALQYNTAGNRNTAIGAQALGVNSTGSSNTAIGHAALIANTSGSQNTAVGKQALQNNTTGGNNTALGYFAGYQDPTVSSFNTLGTISNATALGYGAQVQASNSLILGGQGIIGVSGNAVNVGIGTTNPTNILSVSPDQYDTGTASTTASATVVGSGTTWTAAMVGSEFIFANGNKYTVTAFTDTTHLTLSSSSTNGSQPYRIHRPALQVTNTGLVGIGTASPTGNLQINTSVNTATAFLIQNAAAANALAFDTTNNTLKVFGTAGSNYALVRYDDGTSTAIFAASSGTTQIGTGAGTGGNINLVTTTTNDQQFFKHQVATPLASGSCLVSGTYSCPDFTFTRNLDGSAGSSVLQGSVVKIEDLSNFGSGSSSPDLLSINQGNTSATGNLILAQTGGTGSKFAVSTAGTVTIASGQSYTGAGALTLQAGTSSALTITGKAASTWSTTAGALTITAAAASTWSTSTGDLTLVAGGANKVAIKPGTDSTTAFQVQQAGGTSVLNVDTTNHFVGINTTSPAEALHVAGNILIGAAPNSNVDWTRKSQSTAGTIAEDGGSTTAIDKAITSAVYNGSLYIGTREAGKAEVYRYDGSGNWTQLNITGTAGKFNTTTAIDAVTSMTVFGGYLYIGTSKTDAAEVYRYDGGTTWTQLNVTATAGKFLTTTAIDTVSAMTVHDGNLYIGTTDATVLAQVYRYDGGTTWAVLNATAGTFLSVTAVDGVSAMVSYNNNLYIGTLEANKAQIARYDGGQVWGPVNTGTTSPLIDGVAVDAITSFAVYNGALYAGASEPNATRIFRYDLGSGITAGDYTTWKTISGTAGTIGGGATTAIDTVSALNIYNGNLYAGTTEAGKAEIYKYDGGAQTFTKVTNSTAGGISVTSPPTTTIDGVDTMQVYNGDLWIGTEKSNNAEVYIFTDIENQSYSLKFNAAADTAGAEQNGFLNTASITFLAEEQALNNGQFTGKFSFSHGLTTGAGAYDIAEDYPTRDTSLEAGDVMSIDTSETPFVKKSSGKGDRLVVGIYSSDPALRLSQKDPAINGGRAVPLALAGRVPVKVSNEAGSIKTGDYLTSSSTPGVAMKAVGDVPVFAQAMENFSGSGVGKVMSFIRGSTYSSGILGSVDNIDMKGEKLAFKNESGEEVISFDSDGDATFKGTITADKIKANQIEGLDMLVGRISSLQKPATATASGQTPAQVVPTSGISLMDLSSVETNGGLVVNGAARFNGKSVFMALAEFYGAVDFKDNANFSGHITTSGEGPDVTTEDSAGYKEVPKDWPKDTADPKLATVTVDGNDISGQISAIIGDKAAAGKLVTLKFKKPYAKAPHVLISPANETAAKMKYYVQSTPDGFAFLVTDAPSVGDNIQFNYWVE